MNISFPSVGAKIALWPRHRTRPILLPRPGRPPGASTVQSGSMGKIGITLSISTGKSNMEIQRVKEQKDSTTREPAVQRRCRMRKGNCLDAVVLWEGGDGAGLEKAEKSWCPVCLP